MQTIVSEKTAGDTTIPPSAGQDRVRELLVKILASSTDLEARVWLDGIYTDLQDNQVHGRWMLDRDVYFKVEGRVDRRSVSKQ